MRESVYKISALSYSNTYPFVYALQNKYNGQIGELKFEVPAVSVERFKKGEVDVALVPVGSLPLLKDYNIITDYCIGSYGKVKTVSLFSDVPLDQITEIYLDSESRSSVKLVKILARDLWHIAPRWQNFDSKANPVYRRSVVLIGDKTFGMDKRYKFNFDLSEQWLKLTGLPFVFAVWVARPDVDKGFIAELNSSFAFGLENINKLYDSFLLKISKEEFEDYLRNYIDYSFDASKKEAMNKFLELSKGF